MNDPMQNVTNTKTLDINFNPPVSYNLNSIPTGDILFRSCDLPDNFFYPYSDRFSRTKLCDAISSGRGRKASDLGIYDSYQSMFVESKEFFSKTLDCNDLLNVYLRNNLLQLQTTNLRKEVAAFLKGQAVDILNTVNYPVFVKNRDCQFVFLNDSACSFFGYLREELIGKTDFDIFPEEEATVYRSKDTEVFSSGKENINIENFTNAKGEKSVICTTKSLCYTSFGVLLVGSIQDITQVKKTEKQLLASVEKLSEFAYVVAHDIKAPLSTIFSFLELLERDARHLLSEESKTYLDSIKHAALTADNLVRNLLDYVTSNDISSDIQPVDLGDIIEDVKKNITACMVENNVILTHTNLPMVYGSKVRLYQLFQNLILNSIKFRKEDLSPVITINSTTKDAKHFIVIHDNGIGIEHTHLEKIFHVYTRLNSTDAYPGSGIGLATCEKIVQEMGGTIRVESELGNGTTIIIKLPNI